MNRGITLSPFLYACTWSSNSNKDLGFFRMNSKRWQNLIVVDPQVISKQTDHSSHLPNHAQLWKVITELQMKKIYLSSSHLCQQGTRPLSVCFRFRTSGKSHSQAGSTTRHDYHRSSWSFRIGNCLQKRLWKGGCYEIISWCRCWAYETSEEKTTLEKITETGFKFIWTSQKIDI